MVQPIQAQTKITTDSVGLIAGEVKIPKDGEILHIVQCLTKRQKILWFWWFTKFSVFTNGFKIVCRRFAKTWLYGNAPDLYNRQRRFQSRNEQNFPNSPKVPDSPMSDLDSTLEYG